MPNAQISNYFHLRIETEPLPPVNANDVLIKILAAPIHTYDLNTIEGVYPAGKKPSAIIPGSEGVGEVLSVGSSVNGFSVGDWVIPAKLNFGTSLDHVLIFNLILISSGTWRTHAVVPQKEILKVKKNIKPEYISTISVTPCTAYRLLHDFVDLKEGDVIIQNGASSQVAQAVIQMAHQKKIKTINILRDRTDWPETVERIKAYGGYTIVPEDMVPKAEFRDLIKDLPQPKLALNCVGKFSRLKYAR